MLLALSQTCFAGDTFTAFELQLIRQVVGNCGGRERV